MKEYSPFCKGSVAPVSRNERRAYRYSRKCERKRQNKRILTLACVDAACAAIIIARITAIVLQ